VFSKASDMFKGIGSFQMLCLNINEHHLFMLIVVC